MKSVALVLLIIGLAVVALSNMAGAWPVGSPNAVGPMTDMFVDPRAVSNYRESRLWSPWTSADSICMDVLDVELMIESERVDSAFSPKLVSTNGTVLCYYCFN